MKPLLRTVVAICLLLGSHAHPENIEEVKELPQNKEPVVEAEESEPQARVERCSTCSGTVNLNFPKSPKEIVAALQSLPPGEVHTQQSFEGCSSSKGCAGLKLQDGKITQKFGNLNAFGGDNAIKAASAFGSSVLNGKTSAEPFWWMGANSPFKNVNSASYTSKSSSYTSSGAATGGFGAVDLSKNAFLNPGSLNGQASFESSSYEANQGLNVASNPFLNGNINLGQGFQGGSGVAAAQGANAFANGFGSSSFAGSAADKFAGAGYVGSSPAPFATTGSNVNLLQTAQKDFDFGQAQQTIGEDIFAGSTNAQGLGVQEGLQQTCAGQGYACVLKTQCIGGAVSAATVPLARIQKQYCNTITETCCRLAAPGVAQSTAGLGFEAESQGSGVISNTAAYDASQSTLGFGSTVPSVPAVPAVTAVPIGPTNAFGGVSSAAGLGSTGYGSTLRPVTGLGTDAFSSQSENNNVYRPGSGGLKPGIPYLPPVDNSNSGTNVVSSTAFPSTFVTTPRPVLTPRPVTTPRPFTTARPTYLPPVSSTSAPGYLPPVGEQSINRETFVPSPGYNEGQLILDESRFPSSTRQPIVPILNDIPAGCAAALKCTPVEFCTADGIISNTTVQLTRDQIAYRVPLTDCKDVETGRIGKCCRDPYYTDPWPTNQLGQWIPGAFGNDGKYVPDNRGSDSTQRVTGTPFTSGSTLLNVFSNRGTTPRYPSKGGQTGIIKTVNVGQYEQGGIGQVIQTGVGQYNRQGVGKIGVGQGGQRRGGQIGKFGVGQRGQVGVGQTGQVGIGQRGQVGIGQRGQVGIGQTGQAGIGQRGQVGVGQTGQVGIGQVGQFGVGQVGQVGVGQRGQVGIGQRGQVGVGQRGQVGIGQVGQAGFGQRGQVATGPVGQAGVVQREQVGVGQIGVGQRGESEIGQIGQFGIGQRGEVGVGQSGQFGVGQAGQVGFGQRGQVGVGQRGQVGVGQIGQAGVGQIGQAGIGQIGQAGIGQIGQAGVGQIGQVGVGQRGQVGVGQLGQVGVGQVGQVGVGQRGQIGVGQIGQFGVGQRGEAGIGQIGQFGIGQRGEVGVGQSGEAGVGQIGEVGVGQYDQVGVGQRGQVGVGLIGQTGSAQIDQTGAGAYGGQGQGQIGIQGQGFGIEQGQGAIVNQETGELISFGVGQRKKLGQVSQGITQVVEKGQGQYTEQGVGQGILTGGGLNIKQEGGIAISQGAGIIENESSASTHRIFLQRYDGSGQCGIKHPQKPYGNRENQEVDFAEIPWQAMVLLQTNKSLLCGGVITRPDVVITSASCVDGLEAKNVLIKGGEWKLGIDEEPLPFQIVQVKTIIFHPGYKSGSLKDDVAILHLTENLRLANNIQPICLPDSKDSIDTFYSGAGECIVTGWGKIVLQAHLLGSIMHSVNMSLIEPNECESRLQQDYPHLLDNYDQESCACGAPTNPLSNVCRVDIGSALACTTGDGHFVLQGVYSWDSGCQTTNQLAAFYKFDIEWYEWAIGLKESVRFEQYGFGTKVTTTKYTGQTTGQGQINVGQFGKGQIITTGQGQITKFGVGGIGSSSIFGQGQIEKGSSITTGQVQTNTGEVKNGDGQIDASTIFGKGTSIGQTGSSSNSGQGQITVGQFGKGSVITTGQGQISTGTIYNKNQVQTGQIITTGLGQNTKFGVGKIGSSSIFGQGQIKKGSTITAGQVQTNTGEGPDGDGQFDANSIFAKGTGIGQTGSSSSFGQGQINVGQFGKGQIITTGQGQITKFGVGGIGTSSIFGQGQIEKGSAITTGQVQTNTNEGQNGDGKINLSSIFGKGTGVGQTGSSSTFGQGQISTGQFGSNSLFSKGQIASGPIGSTSIFGQGQTKKGQTITTGEGQIGSIFGKGQITSANYSQVIGSGSLDKFTKLAEGGLGLGSDIKGPISNTFSATYTEKKFFQTEPKIFTYTTKPEFITYTTKPEIVTFTTKPEIVTFTTRPEIFTYTTKPKIVTYTTKPKIITYTTEPKYFTYTTKPQIVTYETSGSGTNPQYAAPEVTYNPSFPAIIGHHQHTPHCKCAEGKK